MKNKSVVFGAAGFMFAIAAAFTSVSANPFATIAWIRVHNVSGGPESCINSQRQCDDTSTAFCKIRTQTTTGVVLAQAYRSGCTVPLFASSVLPGTFVPSPVPNDAIINP